MITKEQSSELYRLAGERVETELELERAKRRANSALAAYDKYVWQLQQPEVQPGQEMAQ